MWDHNGERELRLIASSRGSPAARALRWVLAPEQQWVAIIIGTRSARLLGFFRRSAVTPLNLPLDASITTLRAMTPEAEYRFILGV